VDLDDIKLATLFIALAVLPFALVLDKKRKEKRFAKYKRFGLTPVSARMFKSWAKPRHFSSLSKMGIFNRQHELMGGEYQGHNVALFTHSVADGSNAGKRQTAVIIELSKPAPRFVLRPEWLRDKLKSTFGNHDINFATDAKFSAKYFLQGDDEDAIREIFTAAMRDQLGSRDRQWLESDGEKLLMFEEYEQLTDGENLAQLLDTAVLMKAFVEDGARRAQ
jgi:hypothetical protein